MVRTLSAGPGPVARPGDYVLFDVAARIWAGDQVLPGIPARLGSGKAGRPPVITGTGTLVFVIDILAATRGWHLCAGRRIRIVIMALVLLGERTQNQCVFCRSDRPSEFLDDPGYVRHNDVQAEHPELAIAADSWL